MTIIVDTGFYFALMISKDKYHEKAKKGFQEMMEGKYGKCYTTDYIMDESLTLINQRTQGKRKDLLEKMAKLFMHEEPVAELIKIEIDWIEEIIELQKKVTKDGKPISFTDCSTIIGAKKRKIGYIATFDEHFKGFLRNIE